MSLFDLLFLLAVLASLVTVSVAAAYVVRGRPARALRILGVYSIVALAYLAIGMAIALERPQRVMRTGDAWCFDDWCLAVEKVSRTPASVESSYRVDLRIFSRARRVAQRAKGAWIYLIDDRGSRYSPDPDPSAPPLDVLLRPGESINTWRMFRVPNDAQGVGLVTGHGGAYCGAMSFLVMGESGCLFNKPAMIRIQ